MFENLTERLTGIFNRLNSKGRLTDKDIDEALSLVRRSLLEADVNFRVARDFVAASRRGHRDRKSWRASRPVSRSSRSSTRS